MESFEVHSQSEDSTPHTEFDERIDEIMAKDIVDSSLVTEDDRAYMANWMRTQGEVEKERNA